MHTHTHTHTRTHTHDSKTLRVAARRKYRVQVVKLVAKLVVNWRTSNTTSPCYDVRVEARRNHRVQRAPDFAVLKLPRAT
jgi:hypothetical protein